MDGLVDGEPGSVARELDLPVIGGLAAHTGRDSDPAHAPAAAVNGQTLAEAAEDWHPGGVPAQRQGLPPSPARHEGQGRDPW